MAIYQYREPNIGFSDSRHAAPEHVEPLSNAVDVTSNESLRNALAEYDSKTYSESVLNTMSVNDMVYAWRLISQPESISHQMAKQEIRGK